MQCGVSLITSFIERKEYVFLSVVFRSAPSIAFKPANQHREGLLILAYASGVQSDCCAVEALLNDSSFFCRTFLNMYDPMTHKKGKAI